MGGQSDLIPTDSPRMGLIPWVNEEKNNGSCLWGKDVFPLDFTIRNFSALEEETRKLYQVDDRWMYQDAVGPILRPTPSTLGDRRERLEVWRNANNPAMADRIFPFVRIAMLNETGASLGFRDPPPK